MGKVSIMSIEDFARLFVDAALEDSVVYAVLFYDEARELLKELGTYAFIDFENLELHPAEYDGYEKEYYVYIDSDYNVGVEKAYCEEQKCYLNFGDHLAFITGEASSQIVYTNKDAIFFELQIDPEFDSYFIETEDHIQYHWLTDNFNFDDEEDCDFDSDEYEMTEIDECDIDFIELISVLYDNVKVFSDEDGNIKSVTIDIENIMNSL